MPMPIKFLSLLLASLLLSVPLWAQPLKASVNYIPPFTNTGGKQTIWYELSFINAGITPIKLQKIDILDSARNITALTLDTVAISTRLTSKTRKSPVSTSTIIPAGDTMALYIELTSALVKPATKLIHEIRYDYQSADSARPQTKIVPLKISITPPVAENLVLGPPLKGGPWAAIFSPDWASGHRRVYYTVDGVSRLPGRFAIDFMKLDTTGRFVHGDSDQVKNYYGYGMEVLAVADGVVAATRTDMNESQTISGHPDYSPDSATGNYISIEIGRDQFAFYEHLKPGSIKVKQGQEVKKGQVIALVGFTGQSTGPHLHFHIADINSPLGAEGIPYVFERYNLLGNYPDFSKFGNRTWTISAGEKKVRTSEKPASNSVISF